MKQIKSILFICRHNSARSQMAEAITKHLIGDKMRVASAGLSASPVHPFTIQVLKELGIDWKHANSKTLDEVKPSDFDLVISVCDVDACIAVPEAKQHINWNLEDPAKTNSIHKFRETRDRIFNLVKALIRDLKIGY